MREKNTIFYVGGSKGGIGKSMISTVLVQFLLDTYGDSKTVHLIETDESNPDVGRLYQGKIPVTAFILDEREAGWVTFFELLKKNENTLFVVNSAARSNHGIEVNGANFSAALEEQADLCDLVTFWPLNTNIDCVELLLHYLKIVSYGPVFTVRNNCFGKLEDFFVYDAVMQQPQNKKLAQQRISGILDFPALNEKITLSFYSCGKTLPEVPATLNAFNRQIFQSWKNRAYAMFESTGLFETLPATTTEKGDEE
jgi:hypothetical protein